MCIYKKSCTFAQNFGVDMKSKELLMRDTALVLRLLRRTNSESGMTDLTQADVANSAGISVRYYNKLENGKTLPTIDTLSRIAESYHLPLSEICKLIEEY